MIKKDEWLSEQILKNSYYFSINDLSIKTIENKWDKFKRDHKQENLFVYSKVDTISVEKWQHLENQGFKLIDTNLKFVLASDIKKKIDFDKNKFNISFAKKNQMGDIGEIAKNNFTYSRFHLDPLINNSIANKIKENWVKNYFFGKRGDYLVIACFDNLPLSFLLLIKKNQELIIDLIGVNKKAQGRGLASSMINFAKSNIEHDLVSVGTQVGNVPSIRLYQKLGFILSGSNYIFHYHKK